MISPKYYQLMVDIKSKIDDGTYKPDEMLPSENELIDQYGVSRITVRKALDELANERYLYKIQGKGTFVSTPTAKMGGINLIGSKSCVTELRSRGYKTQRIPLVTRIFDCDEEMAEKYGLIKGERYFEFERIYTGNEIPYSHEQSFYLYRYVSGIENRDLGKESIHTVLNNLGLDGFTTRRATEIKAVKPDPDIMEKLKVDQHMPLLQIRQLSYIRNEGQTSPREICLEVHTALWRSDIIPLCVEI